MNKYESVIIMNPDLNEENRNETINKFVELIKKENGEEAFEKSEVLGLKKLAYEISKHSSGFYVCFYFSSNEEFIRELERVYRITDEVLKFIVVRMED